MPEFEYTATVKYGGQEVLLRVSAADEQRAHALAARGGYEIGTLRRVTLAEPAGGGDLGMRVVAGILMVLGALLLMAASISLIGERIDLEFYLLLLGGGGLLAAGGALSALCQIARRLV